MLEGELDVVVARKLRSPISAELAIGAITGDDGRYLNEPKGRARRAWVDVTAADVAALGPPRVRGGPALLA